MRNIEAQRQLVKQLSEAAKKLEEEVTEKEALEAAYVPDSFDDFASFFQSDFKWEVVEDSRPYWRLKALPLTEAAKKCLEFLLDKGHKVDPVYEIIRNTMGIRKFYRDSTSGSFIYFKAIGGLVGLKPIYEKLPNLKLVVSKEYREITAQSLRDERDRLEKERKDLQEKEKLLNRIELLDEVVPPPPPVNPDVGGALRSYACPLPKDEKKQA